MRILLLCLALLACASTPPPSTVSESACGSGEHRQLDFLIGSWNTAYARAPDRSAGTDTYRLDYNDCVIMEEWTSPDGGERGFGLNVYDRSTSAWRYIFTDSIGAWTEMSGRRENGIMRFEGSAADRANGGGQRLRARMELEPLPDGRVRQTYFTTTDGTTWAQRYQIVMTRR